MIKKNGYTYSVKEAVKEVLCDCVNQGFSEGWSGSECFDEFENELEKFNVHYTNDFLGKFTLER